MFGGSIRQRRAVIASLLVSWIVFSVLAAWPITVTKGNQFTRKSVDQGPSGFIHREPGGSFSADRFTGGSFWFTTSPSHDSIDLDRIAGGKFRLRLETREYGQPATTRTLHRVFVDLNVRYEIDPDAISIGPPDVRWTGVYLDVELPESSPLRRAIADSLEREEPHSISVRCTTVAPNWLLMSSPTIGIPRLRNSKLHSGWEAMKTGMQLTSATPASRQACA